MSGNLGRTFRDLAEKRARLRREFDDVSYDIAAAIVKTLRPILPSIAFYLGGNNGIPGIISFYDTSAGSEGRKFDAECGRVMEFDVVLNNVFSEEAIELFLGVDFDSPDFYLTDEETERVKEALKNMIRCANIDVWS